MTKKLQKTIALPFVLKASADGRLPTEIQIAKTGFWETPWHGSFDLTENDFDQAVANFEAGKYRVNGTEPLAGTLDHLGGESPAAFRITEIFRVGDTLWATVEWTELGKEKLSRDEYRYISFEFCTRANPQPNPENVNEMLVNVVTGATLTNDPLFKKLKPVMASVKGSNNNQEGERMNINDIRAKALADLTEEEKTFLAEHKAELTEEELSKFELAESEETEEQKAAREAAEAADQEAAEKAQLEASTKGMTSEQRAAFSQLQASVKSLEADAKAGREAKLELERTRLTASVKTHVDRGAIKSDQLEAGVDLLMASSESDRSKLTSFLEALPSNDMLKGEAGHGGAGQEEEEIPLSDEEKKIAEKFGNSEDELKATKQAEAGK